VASNNERTPLTPEEEAQFLRWVAANKITDLDAPESRYDYRGYWKEYGNQPIRYGVDHFTDTYKQHGHPLFSSESKYSRGFQDGGGWIGETLIAPPVPSHQSAPVPNQRALLNRLLRGE
jgi:hypothetical protein